jgi:hypothetical protein
MRFPKHVLLAIALIGMSGIALPFVTVRSHGFPKEYTAKELSFGFERTRKALDYKVPGFIEKRLPQDAVWARDDARVVSDAMKWAMALYIPFGLLLLIGIGAQFAGRMGRGTSIVVLLLGIVTAGSWFVLRYAIDYGMNEIALARTTVELSPGAHMLLVVGAVATVCGLLGVIKPDVGKQRSAKMPPGHSSPVV